MEVNMSSPVPEISKMENDGGHVGAVKLTKSQISNRKMKLKKKKKRLESLDKREDTENAKSSVTALSSNFSNMPEVHFSNISVSSLLDKSNSGIGTTAIVDQKTGVSIVAATGDGKSSNLGTENDKGNGAATTLAKAQRKKMRKLAEKELNAMTGGQIENKIVNPRPTLGEVLDPLYLQKLEAVNGEGSGTTAKDNPASKKRKPWKKLNKNPALGFGDTHDKVIAEKDSGTGKVFEARSGEVFTTKSAVPDVMTVPKGEQYPEVHFSNISESSLLDKSNSGLGTTAIVDPKTTLSTVAATGDGKSSNTGTENDKGNCAAKLTKSQRRKMSKLAKKESNAMTGGQIESKIVNRRPTMRELLDSVYLQKLESANGEGSGTTATDKPASKKRKAQKSVNKNPALVCVGTNDKVIAEKGSGVGKVSEATGGEVVTTKSAVPDVMTVPKGEQHPEVHFSNISESSLLDKSNSGFGITAIVDQKMTLSTVAATGDGKSSNTGTENDKGNGAAKITKSQRQKMRKLAKKESNAMTGGQIENKIVNRRPTMGEILDSVYLQKLEAANDEGSGTTATDKPASRKRKAQKSVNKNPALVCMGTHDKVIAEKGSGAGKVFEATGGEMVPPGVTMVPKGELHTEVGNSITLTDSSASKKRKRKASGDIMKTCEKVIEEKGLGTTKSIEAISSEMVTGKNASPGVLMVSKVEEHTEVANGKSATDNPASKKKRKRGKKNKNLALSEITIICDNKQEKGIAENGLGITKSVEAISSEMVTGKNAIPVSSMVSKVEEHTEVASGKTAPGTAATDTTTSKKRKRQKLKKKGLASDVILSIGESAQDTVIVNKVSGTNKPLEALSTESKREDSPELLGDEKGPKTITGDAESTMLKTIGCTKVRNSEVGSTGTTNTAQNLPLPKKTPRQRKKQKSVALNTINNTEVKQINQVSTVGKKLVIFDVNGLLADVVFSGPGDVKADKVIQKRAIFKRPFLDDFLRFCFERFNVGIWSSRKKQILAPVVDFLLGDLKNKLLFIWDASKCTKSWLKTLEDRHKPVVFKDLRNIWEKNDPRNRWVKGTFNESNTLLLDDSPYKALLNPKHSGIFPASYTYKSSDDDFLGPKGELQTYLKGLAAAENVKSYVEQHPFGQAAMDEKNPQWSYYSRALKDQNRWSLLTH